MHSKRSVGRLAGYPRIWDFVCYCDCMVAPTDGRLNTTALPLQGTVPSSASDRLVYPTLPFGAKANRPPTQSCHRWRSLPAPFRYANERWSPMDIARIVFNSCFLVAAAVVTWWAMRFWGMSGISEGISARASGLRVEEAAACGKQIPETETVTFLQQRQPVLSTL